MRKAHIIIVLMLSALIAGLLVGAATASVPGAATGLKAFSGMTTKYLVASGGPGDRSGDIPRASVVAVPSAWVRPSSKANVSPTVAKPTAKVSPRTRFLQVLGRPSPSARPVPSGSPTPIPGGYTPRFPGEVGYKGSPTPTVTPTVKASPIVSPTVRASPIASPTIKASPSPTKAGTRGGTMGTSGNVPSNDLSRYAGTGPGIVDRTLVQPPPSAPGPYASPSAKPVRR